MAGSLGANGSRVWRRAGKLGEDYIIDGREHCGKEVRFYFKLSGKLLEDFWTEQLGGIEGTVY